jgi:ribosomal protein L31
MGKYYLLLILLFSSFQNYAQKLGLNIKGIYIPVKTIIIPQTINVGVEKQISSDFSIQIDVSSNEHPRIYTGSGYDNSKNYNFQFRYYLSKNRDVPMSKFYTSAFYRYITYNYSAEEEPICFRVFERDKTHVEGFLIGYQSPKRLFWDFFCGLGVAQTYNEGQFLCDNGLIKNVSQNTNKSYFRLGLNLGYCF